MCFNFFQKDCSSVQSKLDDLTKQFEIVNSAKNSFYNKFQEQLKINKNLSINLEDSLKYIAELKLQVLNETDPNENYWNSKYPKQNILYERQETDGEYLVDVRDFFQKDFQIPLVSGTNDEKAFNAQNWVYANITHTLDKALFGYEEYWAYAYQTLKRRKGDCEDGAILMANMLVLSGVPYWRVRLNAGDVNGGGHAYVTYCRETDNQFVVLDWCYAPNFKPISERPLHRDVQDYYGIWFSWNSKYSFGKMDTMKGMPKVFVYE